MTGAQRWLVGMQVRRARLSAHPSLSFLRVLPVSACMCALGFQLK